MCCPLILCREETMSRAEGLTQCQDPQKKGQKDGMKKNKKERVQHRRQDAHEQLKLGNLQAGREDHHKSSTLHYMVSSCFNNEGNILR